MINNRFFHMPPDIALVAFSLLTGIALILPGRLGWWQLDVSFITDLDLEHFLMEGVLCFMLFSGASKVHFSKFIFNPPVQGIQYFLCVLFEFTFPNNNYCPTGLL